MPLLRITTNHSVNTEIQTQILTTLSAKIAACLGKSENYVMTAWLPDAAMTFGGQVTPAAYVELDSIGITPEQAKQLSQIICTTITEQAGIESNAIYIKFYDAPRIFWGWNRSTFG